MFRKILLTALVLLLVSGGTTYGDPAITGPNLDTPFHEGESVVITGSGFGTKSTAKPLLWDNFEGGNPGSYITTDNNTTQTSDWTWRVGNITYSDQNNISGSALCSKHDMTGCSTEDRSANLYWVTDANLKKVFVSFWTYFDWGIEDPRHQIKLWRIRSESSLGGDKFLTFKDQHWGPYDAGHYYQFELGEGKSSTDIYYTHILPPPVRQWYRIEFQAEQSDVNVANGSIQVWHGSPGVPMTKVINMSNVVTRDVPHMWDHIAIGQYCTNTPGCPVDCAATNYFDDVYLDNTWARVIVGNASTYDACTIRATQIPTAWSSNQITVTANQGPLPFGTAYLYVFDSNGVRNQNGFQITFERSAKWLAGIVDRWQAGKLSKDDLNRAVYWYLKGTEPIGDPMNELTEEDIGNAIKITD